MPDPRDQAAKWIFYHVPEKSSIGVMDLPWFYSPPLSKEFGYGTVIEREEALTSTPYNIIVFSKFRKPGSWWNPKTAPKYVIISEYEILDALRLKDNRHLTSEQRAEVDRVIGDMNVIQKHYTPRSDFIGKYDGLSLSTDNLPHDMRYVSPNITIYERKK
jgi:hypothetical protein